VNFNRMRYNKVGEFNFLRCEYNRLRPDPMG
jgi:hypothetical protein